MKPINNWNEVKPAGEFENITAGGKIIQIKKVVEKKNRNNDGRHFEILFDVHEGEEKDFFERDYRNQNREDKFWKGIIRQNIPDESSPKFDMQCSFFKRFTNAFEESNPGYHWDWNEAGLVGKICGCVFGEVEKESKKGNIYTAAEPSEIVSVDAIRSGNFKIPDKKLLKRGNNTSSGFAELASGDDGDLPF